MGGDSTLVFSEQLIPKGQADLESKRWQESYGLYHGPWLVSKKKNIPKTYLRPINCKWNWNSYSQKLNFHLKNGRTLPTSPWLRQILRRFPIDDWSSFHRRSHGLKSVRMKLFLLHQMQQIKCYYSEKLNDQIKPSGNEKYNISFSIQYIICILHNMIIYIYMMQYAQMKFWTVNYNQLQHLVSIRWAAARVQCMIHSWKSLSDN